MVLYKQTLHKIPTLDRFYALYLSRYTLLCITLIIMTSSLQVQATENSLTLTEAVQRTFNNNPELQTFQYKLEAQQGRMVQTSLSAKPKLDLLVEDVLGTGD